MSKQRELYQLMLKLSSLLGISDPGGAPSDYILRLLYSIGEISYSAAASTYSAAKEVISELSSIIGISDAQPSNISEIPNSLNSLKSSASDILSRMKYDLNLFASTIGASPPAVNSFNEAEQSLSGLLGSSASSSQNTLASLVSGGFQHLNEAASFFFKSYNADGKLSTLVEDLKDLASRSDSIKSFLQKIYIPDLTYNRILKFVGVGGDDNVLNAYHVNFGASIVCSGNTIGIGCDKIAQLPCNVFTNQFNCGWLTTYNLCVSLFYCSMDFISTDPNTGNIWIKSKAHLTYVPVNGNTVCRAAIWMASVNGTYGKNPLYVGVHKETNHIIKTVYPGDTVTNLTTAWKCDDQPGFEEAVILPEGTYYTALKLINDLA